MPGDGGATPSQDCLTLHRKLDPCFPLIILISHIYCIDIVLIIHYTSVKNTY